MSGVYESADLSQHLIHDNTSYDPSARRMEPIGEDCSSIDISIKPIEGQESFNSVPLQASSSSDGDLDNVALDLSMEAVSEAVSELVQEKDTQAPDASQIWSDGATGLLIDLSDGMTQHLMASEMSRPSEAQADSVSLTQYYDGEDNMWRSLSQHSDDSYKMRDSASSALSQTQAGRAQVIEDARSGEGAVSSLLSRGKSSSPEYLAMFSTRPGTVIEKLLEPGGSSAVPDINNKSEVDSLMGHSGAVLDAREILLAHADQDLSLRYSIGDTVVHTGKEPIVASTPHSVRDFMLDREKDPAERSDSGRASSPASGDLGASRSSKDFHDALHNLSLDQDITKDFEERMRMIDDTDHKEQASNQFDSDFKSVSGDGRSMDGTHTERRGLVNLGKDTGGLFKPLNADIDLSKRGDNSKFPDDSQTIYMTQELSEASSFADGTSVMNHENSGNLGQHIPTSLPGNAILQEPWKTGQSLQYDAAIDGKAPVIEAMLNRPASAASVPPSADTTKESDADDIDRITQEYRSILHEHMDDLGPTGFSTTESDTTGPKFEDIKRQHEEKQKLTDKTRQKVSDHVENVLLEGSREFKPVRDDCNASSGSDTEDALDRDVRKLLAKYGRSFSDSEDDKAIRRESRKSPTDSIKSLESTASDKLSRVMQGTPSGDTVADDVVACALPTYLFDDPSKSMSLPHLGDTYVDSPQITPSVSREAVEEMESKDYRQPDLAAPAEGKSTYVESSEDELGYKVADVLKSTNHLRGGEASRITEAVSDMESLNSSRTGSIDYGTLERDLDEIQLNLESSRSRSQSSDKNGSAAQVGLSGRSSRGSSRASTGSHISGKSRHSGNGYSGSIDDANKVIITSGGSHHGTPSKYADPAVNISRTEDKGNPNLSLLDLGVDPILTSGVIPMELALEIVHDKNYISSGRPKYTLDKSYSASPQKSQTPGRGHPSASEALDIYIDKDLVDPHKTGEDLEVEALEKKQDPNVSNQSFSERVQDILERGSPPRQAYKYLEEAEKHKENLERSYREHEKSYREFQEAVERKAREVREELQQPTSVIITEDSLHKADESSFEVSPVQKLTPFNKFGNVRSIFSSQLNKANARVFDLDQSIEFGSPAKRYMESRQVTEIDEGGPNVVHNSSSDRRSADYGGITSRHSPVDDQFEKHAPIYSQSFTEPKRYSSPSEGRAACENQTQPHPTSVDISGRSYDIQKTEDVNPDRELRKRLLEQHSRHDIHRDDVNPYIGQSKPDVKYDKDDRGSSDRQRRRGDQDDRGYSDWQRRQGNQDDRGYSDLQRRQGDQDDRGYSVVQRRRGDQDDRGSSDRQQRQGDQDDRGSSDRQQRQGDQDNRGSSDRQRRQGDQDDRGYSDRQRRQEIDLVTQKSSPADSDEFSPTEGRLRREFRTGEEVVRDALSPSHTSSLTKALDARGANKTLPGSPSPASTSSSRERSRPSSTERTPRRLVPYRPHGSQDVYYVEVATDDASVAGMSDITVESTHTGSDDARGPSFPSHVLGSRKDSPNDSAGIYSKDPKAAQPSLGTIQEQNSFSNGSSDKDKEAAEKLELSGKSRRAEEKVRSYKTVEEWMNGSLGRSYVSDEDPDKSKSIMEDELSSREPTPRYKTPVNPTLIEDQLSPDRPKWDSDCFSTPQKAGGTSFNDSSLTKGVDVTGGSEESPGQQSKITTAFTDNSEVTNKTGVSFDDSSLMKGKGPLMHDNTSLAQSHHATSMDDSSLVKFSEASPSSGLGRFDSVKSSPGIDTGGDVTPGVTDPTLRSMMLQRSALPMESRIRQQREAVLKKYGYDEGVDNQTERTVMSKPPIYDQALDRDKDYHRRLEQRLSPLTVGKDEFQPLIADKNEDDYVRELLHGVADRSFRDRSADSFNTDDLLTLAGVKTPVLQSPQSRHVRESGLDMLSSYPDVQYSSSYGPSYTTHGVSNSQGIQGSLANSVRKAYESSRSAQRSRSPYDEELVELHKKSENENSSQERPRLGKSSGSRSPSRGSRSPSHGSRSPSRGSRSPSRGSRSPSRSSQRSPSRRDDDNVVECSPGAIQDPPVSHHDLPQSPLLSPDEVRRREQRDREYQRLIQKAQDISGHQSPQPKLPSNVNTVWKKFQQRQLDRSRGSSDEDSLRLSKEGPDVSGILRNPVQHFVRSTVGTRDGAPQETFEEERSRVESWKARQVQGSENSAGKSDGNVQSSNKGPVTSHSATSLRYRTSVSDKLHDGGEESSEDSDRARSHQHAPEDAMEDDPDRGQGQELSAAQEAHLRPRKLAWVIQDETLASVPEDSTLDSISSDFTTSSELDSDGKLVTHTTKRHLPDDPKLLRLQRKISQQKEKYKRERVRELQRKERIHQMERLLRDKGRNYRGSPGRNRVAFSEDPDQRRTSNGTKSTSTPSKYQDSLSGSTTLSLSNITTSSATVTPEDDSTLYDTLTSPDMSSHHHYQTEPVCVCRPTRKSTSPSREATSTSKQYHSSARKSSSPSRQAPASLRLQQVDYTAAAADTQGPQTRKSQKKSSPSKYRDDKENNEDLYAKKTKNASNMKAREKMVVIKDGDNMNVYIRKPDTVDSATNFPSPTPKRHYQQVSMVSEGIQTSPMREDIQAVSLPSQKSTSPKRGRDKSTSPLRNTRESTRMFVPESSTRHRSNQIKRKKKVKTKPGVAWFLPFDEPRPWRKPLKERQDYASSLAGTLHTTDVNTRQSQPVKHKLEAWSLGSEAAEKRGGELEADIYMQRSRSSVPDDPLMLEKDQGKLSLQDACQRYNPWFISRSRERQKHVEIRAEERRIQELHREERARLFGGEERLGMHRNVHPLSEDLFKPKRRFMTRQEMKELTQRTVRRLPEVVRASEEKKRQEEYKTNRLRAKLYKQRILNKVLRKSKRW